jgi:arylsulfatase
MDTTPHVPRRFPKGLRRCRAVIWASVLAILGLTVSATSQAAEASPPNVIVIVADDLGYRELGCYGQRWIRTPHLDRMAAEGTRFTQFYSGQAVCAPSRCVLMTGKHTGHAEIRDNGNPSTDEALKSRFGWEFPGQHPLPDAAITLAELLHDRGYATAAIGKWGLGHVGTTGDPTRQGFDLFYGFHCQVHAHNHYPRFLWRNDVKESLPGNDATLTGATYSQDRFMDVAREFIRTHRDRSFFLYLPFTIPHLSIQVPEASLAEYVATIPEEDYVHRGYLKHPAPRAGYAAMVSHMDRGVGQLFSLLKELGLDEQTCVLFTSDNGPTYERLGGSDSDFFESAGVFRGLKGSLYEGGIRVPLLARWPGHVPAGAVSDHVAAFWDILPTLCELTGTTAPAGLDGLSFAPTLTGHSAQQKSHEFLYWEFPAYGGQQAVRLGDWKGIRQNMLRRDNPRPLDIELFHLAADPGEQDNVAASHPEIVHRMREVMTREHVPSQLFPFPVLDRDAPAAD